MTRFSKILNDVLSRYPSAQALGDAIGMTGSRVLRASKGDATFDVLHCLRLAEVSEASPSDILRAAGRGEIADLIEGQYGKPTPRQTVSPDERAILTAWNRMPAATRKRLAPIVVDLVK